MLRLEKMHRYGEGGGGNGYIVSNGPRQEGDRPPPVSCGTCVRVDKAKKYGRQGNIGHVWVCLARARDAGSPERASRSGREIAHSSTQPIVHNASSKAKQTNVPTRFRGHSLSSPFGREDFFSVLLRFVSFRFYFVTPFCQEKKEKKRHVRRTHKSVLFRLGGCSPRPRGISSSPTPFSLQNPIICCTKSQSQGKKNKQTKRGRGSIV